MSSLVFLLEALCWWALKNDNNNNNKQICIAPKGRNFRGAGTRQHVCEQRKKRKPERRGMSLA